MAEPKEKLDYLNPGFIMAFIMAGIGDFAFIFAIGLAIPVVGVVIGGFIQLAHYFAGAVLLFLVLPRLKHLIPKVILFIGIILPLPTLTLGVIIAIVMQNKFIEAVVIQVVTKAAEAALVASGFGAPAAPIVEAAADIKTATTVARGIKTAGTAIKGVKGAAAAERGVQATEQAGQATQKVRLVEKKLREKADERDAAEDARREAASEVRTDNSGNQIDLREETEQADLPLAT